MQKGGNTGGKLEQRVNAEAPKRVRTKHPRMGASCPQFLLLNSLHPIPPAIFHALNDTPINSTGSRTNI